MGGDPSYGTITRRINDNGAEPQARKSTVADCFRVGRLRLSADLVLAVVRVLHDDPAYVERWQRALRFVTGQSEASAHITVQDELPEDLAGFTGRTAELKLLRDQPLRRGPGAGRGRSCRVRVGDYETARADLLDAFALYREVGSPGGEGGALDALGEPSIWTGHPARAIEYFEQSLRIFRRIGARDAESGALNGLGEAAHEQGRYADAITWFTEALAVSTDVSSGALQARAHAGLGHAHRALGDPVDADHHARQAATLYASLAVSPTPSPADR